MYILYGFTFCLLLIGKSYAEDYDYIESYFDQKIDHFNFLSKGNQTYKMRYLWNATWWYAGTGPIFFYAGNEGDVVDFWKNTGFMFKVAKQFSGLVLFAEHRYYGKSLPFGNDSFNGENIGYLSVNQVLADYAFFLKSFKETIMAEKSPIIAFGGSYGGMLAAYMRFKYPNIIHGAIAASAPLYFMEGKLPGEVFFQAITKVFNDTSPQCETQVRSAFSQLDKWAAEGQAGYSEITRTFRLCKPLNSAQDYDHLLRWARMAFVTASLMNYPYPSSFMGNYPAFPVKVMCNLLESAARPVDGLCQAVSLYYNASEAVDCFDIYEEYIYCPDYSGCGLGFDAIAWGYLVCTEINLVGGTTGIVDMFPDLPFTSQMREEYCNKTYKVIPRRDYLDVQYWGGDISSASNIIFSNGNLDPCTSGGILKNISDSLIAVIIDGSAHHLDLREDNPNDPASVRSVREFELENILNWLVEYYEKLNQ